MLKHKTLVGLLVVAAVWVAPAIFAQRTDEIRSAHLALRQAGTGYPDVVGEVNGTQISGRELGAREYVVQKNNPGLGAEHVREVALHAITEERVLLEAAAREGLVVDTREVLDEIGRFRRLAAENEELRDAFRATAEQLGVPEDAVFDDDRVIALYRKAFTLGRMRERIAQSLPAERRGDPGALQGAVDEFVSEKQPRVRTFIRNQ